MGDHFCSVVCQALLCAGDIAINQIYEPPDVSLNTSRGNGTGQCRRFGQVLPLQVYACRLIYCWQCHNTGLKSHGFCLQTVGHRDEQTGPVKVLKVDEGNIKQTHCNLKSMGSFIWFINYYRSNVFFAVLSTLFLKGHVTH